MFKSRSILNKIDYNPQERKIINQYPIANSYDFDIISHDDDLTDYEDMDILDDYLSNYQYELQDLDKLVDIFLERYNTKQAEYISSILAEKIHNIFGLNINGNVTKLLYYMITKTYDICKSLQKMMVDYIVDKYKKFNDSIKKHNVESVEFQVAFHFLQSNKNTNKLLTIMDNIDDDNFKKFILQKIRNPYFHELISMNIFSNFKQTLLYLSKQNEKSIKYNQIAKIAKKVRNE